MSIDHDNSLQEIEDQGNLVKVKVMGQASAVGPTSNDGSFFSDFAIVFVLLTVL